MRKLILPFFAITVIFFSCGKSGNKDVLKTEDNTILADNGKVDENVSYNTDVNGKKMVRTNFQYKATDGTPVKVIFDYEPGTSDVEISSNGKTFKLDKVKSDGIITLYEKVS